MTFPPTAQHLSAQQQSDAPPCDVRHYATLLTHIVASIRHIWEFMVLRAMKQTMN